MNYAAVSEWLLERIQEETSELNRLNGLDPRYFSEDEEVNEDLKYDQIALTQAKLDFLEWELANVQALHSDPNLAFIDALKPTMERGAQSGQEMLEEELDGGDEEWFPPGSPWAVPFVPE